jgi:hypothetical protein
VDERVTAKVFALHLEVSITEPRVFLFFDKTTQRCCWKKMEHTKNKLDPCEPQWQDKGKGMLYVPVPGPDGLRRHLDALLYLDFGLQRPGGHFTIISQEPPLCDCMRLERRKTYLFWASSSRHAGRRTDFLSLACIQHAATA